VRPGVAAISVSAPFAFTRIALRGRQGRLESTARHRHERRWRNPGRRKNEMTVTAHAIAPSAPKRETRVLAVLTLAAGLAVVYLTGFAHSATVHNAAHDTRHAMAFPCH
jgi:cobalt transporter subunit CbtB